MIWNTLSICTVVWSLGMQWDAWFVLWAWSYQSCMGECMGPHTFCMEPPIHAWCAQYSYEHTVHGLIWVDSEYAYMIHACARAAGCMNSAWSDLSGFRICIHDSCMRARSWLYACALLDGLEILLFMKYRIHAWVRRREPRLFSFIFCYSNHIWKDARSAWI